MMNLQFTILDSTAALKLALSLGHFLWQGAVIGLSVLAAGFVLRDRAQWRYTVNVVGLVLMAACLPVNLLWVDINAGETNAPSITQPRGTVVSKEGGTTSLADNDPGTAQRELPRNRVRETVDQGRPLLAEGDASTGFEFERVAAAPSVTNDHRQSATDTTAPRGWPTSVAARSAPTLVLAWLLGVAAFSLRLLLATSHGYQLRRRAAPVAESVHNVTQRLARELGIRGEVFVGLCESVAVPVAVGILRPAVLFPSAVLTGLTPSQIELVLQHELSHFRRCDHLVVVLQRLVETLLFFHPAVWIVSRQVSVQREHCCDAEVVRLGAEPLAYAGCLLRIAELQTTRQSVPAVTLASDGHRPSQLRSRVARILGMPDPAQGRFALGGIVALTILVGGCLWSLTREAAIAQPAVVSSSDPLTGAEPSESEPDENATSTPEIVSVRLTLEDASGESVEASSTNLEYASRGYGGANSDPVSFRDGLLRLKPGKHMLAFRPDVRGAATLIDVNVPPRNSSRTVRVRDQAEWSVDDAASLQLEPNVVEREFGNHIGVKIRNRGDDDVTLSRVDVQFLTERWRIIPTEARHLDGYTLNPSGEHTHHFSWSSAVRSGIWIPRHHEEILAGEPPEEVPGKWNVGVQIGPSVYSEWLQVEDPDLVLARDERYRRDGKVSVVLDKQEFVLGENILLHYSVENQGEEPILISVGGDNRGSPRALRFKVHVFDDAGVRVTDPHPNPWNMGGLGVHPEVKPGEKYWLSIPLMDYAALQKPGTYRVRVFHDLGWDEWTEIPETTDNSLPKSETVAPIVETKFRLRAPNVAEAQAAVDRAKQPRPESSWGHRAPSHGAWSALRFPVYLPLLMQAAEEHDQAIRTMASIRTPAATDALIGLAEEGSAIAASLLPARLPHPNFKHRANWNKNWSLREQFVRDSWRGDYGERVRQIAWQLLEGAETEPYDERKNDWMLGGSILLGIGRAEDFDRLIAAANPIVESLGTVAAEQNQYPAPATVIANLFSTGRQLIHRGGRPDLKPQTAFESMMFMAAIESLDDFRPDGWQTQARRLMRHAMPRVRSICVGSLPRPLEEQFVAPMIALFEDSSPLVAATALLSAGAAKDERFLEAVLKVARDAEDKWVRGAANHAAANCRPSEEQPVGSGAEPPEETGAARDQTGATDDSPAEVLAQARWSKPLNGLRIRTATRTTRYRAGDRLPLHIQLENVTPQPIPFRKLSRQVRVRVQDESGEWVGIARHDFDISPWEGRSGELRPGQVLQWTVRLERFRFNRPIEPESTVTVAVSVPSQIEEPGKLPRTEYSEPIAIRFDRAPTSNLRNADFDGEWSRETSIVYREVGGLFAPSRAIRIDGNGVCTAVRPESRNAPQDPLLPIGRTSMPVPAERLNRIVGLLSECDLRTLTSETRRANPDEPEFLLSICMGGRNLSGAFPAGVVQDSADLTAIQNELRDLMRLVQSTTKASAAPNDPVTNRRKRKLLDGADSFRFQLYYYGQSDKPFYSLDLQTRPLESNHFFTRIHQLDRRQLVALIDGLARGGFLRNGKAERPPNPTYKEGYILFLSCQDYMQYEVLGFPDNKEMVARLIGLASSLKGEAARSMSLLLTRIGVRPDDLPPMKAVSREPIPKELRLRVYQGNPSVDKALQPVLDRKIATGKTFDLKSKAGLSVSGKLFRAVTGRPRFKATVRHGSGTNEFDAEVTLGKPVRSYGGVFASGILEFVVRLDPLE